MAGENPESKRKGGGGKLARSETVTVRLDPKLRYLAELAARKHRRTVSSYIEWAVEESLSRVYLREESGDSRDDYQRAISIGAMADGLWDVDEADRLAKLAMQFPELLTHEEQVLWKLVRENGLLWKGRFDNATGEWTWRVEYDGLIYARLREHWVTFLAVAKGELDRSSLPTWVKTRPEPEIDDIPF